MRRVDLEVDRLSVDALVVTGNSGCLVLNLALDIAKIVEPAVGYVVELCPLGTASSTRGSIRIACRVGSVFIFGNVDELKDQGTTSADAGPAR